MKIDSEDFRVRPGKKVKLGAWPTSVKAFFSSKNHYRSLLEEHIQKLSLLQSMLYACDQNAVLLIFQAMDAAGKDGAIKHVMSGVNPQGCEVFSFKHPSAEELDHDFLWRTTQRLPERGRIGIFNRSYYEEVLIVRVHPEILLDRKSTRLNSSHVAISYAVFCLKKKIQYKVKRRRKVSFANASPTILQ